jgi:hypothetical protein
MCPRPVTPRRGRWASDSGRSLFKKQRKEVGNGNVQESLSNFCFSIFSSSRNAVCIFGETRCPSATRLTIDGLTFTLRAILA